MNYLLLLIESCMPSIFALTNLNLKLNFSLHFILLGAEAPLCHKDEYWVSRPAPPTRGKLLEILASAERRKW